MKLRRRVLIFIEKKYSGSEKSDSALPSPPSTRLMKMGLWSITRRCAAGYWSEHLWSRRKGKKHYQRRERKEHFGELVQLDGMKSK